MLRAGQGRNTPRSGRSALQRASGFGAHGREQRGKDGFGYLVRGARIEPGDHVVRPDGSVGKVKHVPTGMVEKQITFHDGQVMHVSPSAHYSVGDQ